MYAQVLHFDGPRSPELIEAAARAYRERVEPAIRSRPELWDDMVAMYELRQPDGSQVSVVIVRSEGTLQAAEDVIMSTELLPGEDPALLPGPDRVERYEVVRAVTATPASVR
jgi:hypothetical protein